MPNAPSSSAATPPPGPPVRRWRARVLDHRPLSSTAFELTLSRDGLAFRAGQLLNVHGRDPLDDRNYTIASGEQDDVLHVIYRLIPGGRLTPQLASLGAGDDLDVSGPMGEFVLRDLARPIVFIATGTGIAPARSYWRTHPGLDLTLLHGVRSQEDLFYRTEFAGASYHPCVSGAAGVGFHGRVTGLLRDMSLAPETHLYLCGANEMFYDVRDILQARGFPLSQVFTEAYYYSDDA